MAELDYSVGIIRDATSGVALSGMEVEEYLEFLNLRTAARATTGSGSFKRDHPRAAMADMSLCPQQNRRADIIDLSEPTPIKASTQRVWWSETGDDNHVLADLNNNRCDADDLLSAVNAHRVSKRRSSREVTRRSGSSWPLAPAPAMSAWASSPPPSQREAQAESTADTFLQMLNQIDGTADGENATAAANEAPPPPKRPFFRQGASSKLLVHSENSPAAANEAPPPPKRSFLLKQGASKKLLVADWLSIPSPLPSPPSHDASEWLW